MDTSINFLTIPEEIFLLSLYDNEGDASILQKRTFDIILAGAILMDLALRNCIDTDLEELIPDKVEPTDDFVLDEVLSDINNEDKNKSISYWLEKISLKSEKFRDLIISNLIKKGIIKIEDRKILWISATPKYPLIGTDEVKEVRVRVREEVFSNEIPEFRDIVIVSLVENGGLLELVFTEDEISEYRERISQIAKMDLIGQAIAGTIKDTVINNIKSKAHELLGLKSKTPEEKLDVLISDIKTRFRIKNNDKLPEWLRMGTEQFKKTLAFIKESGTANIVYNKHTKTYNIKSYSSNMHLFGSGG
jgi:golgi phosphoprotein 3